MLHVVARRGIGTDAADRLYPAPMAQTGGAEVIRTGRQIYVPSSAEGSWLMRQAAEVMGDFSLVMTPLVWEGRGIGMITSVRTPNAVFTEKELALLRTFADQAVIAIENARLFNELQARTRDLSESLQQQTATADVLKVISRSAFDLQTVLQTLVESAAKLCNADMAAIWLRDGEVLRARATVGMSAQYIEFLSDYPIGRERGKFIGRTFLTGEVVHLPDVLADPEYESVKSPRIGEHRAALGVPMIREGRVEGVFGMGRAEPGPYADREIELVRTFVDQALIAIENVRLFNETQEALERQTATADILKVIASSPDDVQPVFDAIAERAKRLVGAHATTVLRVVGDMVELAAFTHVSEEADAVLRASFPLPIEGNPDFEKLRCGETAETIDRELESVHPELKKIARARGFRSRLLVPLKSDGGVIGAISVTRVEPGSFASHHVQLLQTFADQAVIAIQNVRLFNETKEALERQTATADILKVIASSPDDVQPVFEAIAERSNRIVDGRSTAVYSLVDGTLHLKAFTLQTNPEADDALRAYFPRRLSEMIWGEPIARGEMYEVEDMQDPSIPQDARDLAQARGFRSVLLVPLVRDRQTIGAIGVTRAAPGRSSAHHIQLLRTFADQAVIAIENVRLFNETKEALERQTATSEVLEIISSSPGELDPVFQKMLENACRVCEANFGTMNLWNGEEFNNVARHNMPPAFAAFRQQTPIRPHPDTPMAKVVRTHQFVHEHDYRTSPAYLAGVPTAVAIVDIAGARTLLVVPMLKENELIGTITIFRQEVRPFTDKQIALVENFTKQAVIAIENTRLLRELRERTDDLQESLQQQTAASEVLRVISSSSGDLQPVFKAMLANALKICEAAFGNLLLFDGTGFEAAELHTAPQAYRDFFKEGRLIPSPATALGRIVATKQVVHIPDLLAERGVEQNPLRIATIEILGARTLLAVPMLRDNELVGAIVIYRQEARPFGKKQIDLVTNFADQAVIAIENARLLNELRARTRELSQSLDDLRTAQDRLVQTEKLASLGQLTAGIAHEIKNPLNFVNNFSALSSELTDELNDLLKQAALTDKMREEVDELTRLLKENLEKIEQHGKRADSIVKNMLLHSREGSGEQRPADINTLVDESLNLAYHGARAEKSGFNITLARDFDAGAGSAELFPQEMTRALLNLISNGFYAATKRKNENGEVEFEPTLLATTKNLGSTVEIRIRDNGTGIPPEVKEKMFNPFFTTKPAGEGTGLGLSMTHDIVVKQHGGRIEVATEPGQFTEFTIVLPRAGSPRKTR
jgi:two-component system NtrC family sensor kinase